MQTRHHSDIHGIPLLSINTIDDQSSSHLPSARAKKGDQNLHLARNLRLGDEWKDLLTEDELRWGNVVHGPRRFITPM